MKEKKISLILILPILFPYLILFSLFCLFTNKFIDILFNNNGLFILLYLIIIYIIALICIIIYFIINIIFKMDPVKILKINMIIKLIQIPAYIIIFIISLMSLITIFTMGISLLLIIFDCMAIFLTGLIGLSGIIRGFIDKKLTLSDTIVYSIFQFIFCLDILFSILAYKKIKSNTCA